jgi:hypothetical protein
VPGGETMNENEGQRELSREESFLLLNETRRARIVTLYYSSYIGLMMMGVVCLVLNQHLFHWSDLKKWKKIFFWLPIPSSSLSFVVVLQFCCGENWNL